MTVAKMLTPNERSVKCCAIVGLTAFRATTAAYESAKKVRKEKPITGSCCLCCLAGCAAAEASSVFACMEACVPVGVFVSEFSTFFDICVSSCGECCVLDDGAPAYKDQTWGQRLGCEKIERGEPKLVCFKWHDGVKGLCTLKFGICVSQICGLVTEPIKATCEIGACAPAALDSCRADGSHAPASPCVPRDILAQS